MKIKKFTVMLLVLIMAFTCFACGGTGNSDGNNGGDDENPPQVDTSWDITDSAEMVRRAASLAERVAQTFVKGSYAVNNYNDANQATASLWPYTEIVAMYNRLYAATKDVTYKTKLEQAISGLAYYKGTSNDPANTSKYHSGRGSSTGGGYGTVFYDDNIWVAREFYEAYVNTQNADYLKESVAIVNFIMAEGYEPELKGIYWDQDTQNIYNGETSEGKGATINVCTTAPTIMMLCKLSDYITDTAKQAQYRTWATQMFSATYQNFRDVDTNCYYDRRSVVINEATKKKEYKNIDTAIIPYNTACMVIAGVELYRLNPTNEAFLNASKASAAGADMSIGRLDNTAKVKAYSYNSWFNVLLLDSFIELKSADAELSAQYVENMRKSVNYGYKNFLATEGADQGFMSPSWVRGWSDISFKDNNGAKESGDLLLHAANAETYALLAAYYAN